MPSIYFKHLFFKFVIILGKAIAIFLAKLDGICDKSRVKQFNFGFVPVLFLATGIILTFKYRRKK